MEVAVGAGADDVDTDDDGTIEVTTPAEEFSAVREALTSGGLTPEIAEIVQRPANETPLEGEDAEKAMRLIDALEELDDVHDVYTNASFPEDMQPAG